MRVPLEPAVRRDAGANVRGVLDELLIPDFVQGVSEAGAPMAHQPVMSRVVTGQVVEIVAERIGLSKQHAVHGKATVERLAADNDNLRVG